VAKENTGYILASNLDFRFLFKKEKKKKISIAIPMHDNFMIELKHELQDH